MITRSKLVEQLRDYQIRSQHKCPALAVFSPKPILTTWYFLEISYVFLINFTSRLECLSVILFYFLCVAMLVELCTFEPC